MHRLHDELMEIEMAISDVRYKKRDLERGYCEEFEFESELSRLTYELEYVLSWGEISDEVEEEVSEILEKLVDPESAARVQQEAARKRRQKWQENRDALEMAEEAEDDWQMKKEILREQKFAVDTMDSVEQAPTSDDIFMSALNELEALVNGEMW